MVLYGEDTGNSKTLQECVGQCFRVKNEKCQAVVFNATENKCSYGDVKNKGGGFKSAQTYNEFIHIDKGRNISVKMDSFVNYGCSYVISVSIQSNVLNTFLRLHDMPNQNWARKIYSFDQNNAAKSHVDCGVLCAVQFPSTCQVYIQDHSTCTLGTVTKTDGAYSAIGSTRHVYVDSG